PTTVTAGLGFYRSDQAVAVGIYHYIRDSVLVNVGGAFNLNGHGDAMGRAGISFALGKGAGKGGRSVGRDLVAMQEKMDAMQARMQEFESKDKANQDKIASLEAENNENKKIIAENKKVMEDNQKTIEKSMKIIEELQKKLEGKKK
ncbi:MAG: YadA-like family protein, partial [Synergistes sp.]|nr:YadA-like family protein [Synergistes sp.]